MPDIVTSFQVLRNTPLPNILVIAGVILIFLAIVGQFVGQIQIEPDRQKWAGIVGIVFLFSGVGLYLVPNSGPPAISSVTPALYTPTSTKALNAPSSTDTPAMSLS